MSYVVWRDLDIVTLQKAIVDETGQTEHAASEGAKAQTKIEEMRQAGLANAERPLITPWFD